MRFKMLIKPLKITCECYDNMEYFMVAHIFTVSLLLKVFSILSIYWYNQKLLNFSSLHYSSKKLLKKTWTEFCIVQAFE